LIPCEAEGSDPIVGGCCVGVAKTVRETDSYTFYFSEDTFDSIPISMFLIFEIVAVTLTRSLQRVRSIDEKHGVINVVFLGEFREG